MAGQARPRGFVQAMPVIVRPALRRLRYTDRKKDNRMAGNINSVAAVKRGNDRERFFRESCHAMAASVIPVPISGRTRSLGR
jgi:hypothetical protein